MLHFRRLCASLRPVSMFPFLYLDVPLSHYCAPPQACISSSSRCSVSNSGFTVCGACQRGGTEVHTLRASWRRGDSRPGQSHQCGLSRDIFYLRGVNCKVLARRVQRLPCVNIQHRWKQQEGWMDAGLQGFRASPCTSYCL